MVGHGWRIRNLVYGLSKAIKIWVHRLLCKGCGRTSTVIPDVVHPAKQYALETITDTLKRIRDEGHYLYKHVVSVPLQRLWKRELWQTSIQENRGEDEVLAKSAVPTGASHVIEVKNRETLLQLKTAGGTTHHTIILFSG